MRGTRHAYSGSDRMSEAVYGPTVLFCVGYQSSGSVTTGEHLSQVQGSLQNRLQPWPHGSFLIQASLQKTSDSGKGWHVY